MDGRFESGIRFRVQAAVRTDGKATVERGRIVVRGAHEILIAVNIGVGVRGRKADVECGPMTVPAGSWDELLATHRAEHRRHFGGLTLDLPLTVPDMPTDQRIEAYRRGADDPALPQLYFNYGRYLLCASCANAEQPANLQGKWNEEVAAFYEDYLFEAPDGALLIAPSQSPENRFKGSGDLFPVSIGINAAMDVELAHDAFRFAMEASRVLDVDAGKRKRWEALKARRTARVPTTPRIRSAGATAKPGPSGMARRFSRPRKMSLRSAR